MCVHAISGWVTCRLIAWPPNNTKRRGGGGREWRVVTKGDWGFAWTAEGRWFLYRERTWVKRWKMRESCKKKEAEFLFFPFLLSIFKSWSVFTGTIQLEELTDRAHTYIRGHRGEIGETDKERGSKTESTSKEEHSERGKIIEKAELW